MEAKLDAQDTFVGRVLEKLHADQALHRQKVAEQVSVYGLEKNIEQTEKVGYTIIENVAPPAFMARLREACLRVHSEKWNPSVLLGKDPVFEEALLNSKLQAFVEALCGANPSLYKLTCTVRSQGTGDLPTHADEAEMPEPHPEWTTKVTACWVCDEFTEAGGCTKIIPGSNLKRRAPTAEESKADEGAIPAECPQGSVVVWTGSTWHGNYPRTLEGERVVLHVTMTPSMFKATDYNDHLDASWFEGRPEALKSMLGRLPRRFGFG